MVTFLQNEKLCKDGKSRQYNALPIIESSALSKSTRKVEELEQKEDSNTSQNQAY